MGVETSPYLQQVTDDRWYTKPAQTYFSQKDMIGWYGLSYRIFP